MPLTFSAESDYDKIDQGDDLEIVAVRKNNYGRWNISSAKQNQEHVFYVTCVLSERQKKIILAGGALNIRN